ncbi:hypothetical protein ACKKBF_B04495 [Auxenochlorella protothecoides x Auxenochlorella symbiontica]
MDRLKPLVEPLKAGPALLGVLQSAHLAQSILPGLIADVLDEGLHQKGEPGPTPPASTQGPAAQPSLCTVPQLNFVTPRGKHDLAFHDKSFSLHSPKTSISIPYAAVTHILILDSLPGDSKGKVLLFLVISHHAGLLNGKSPLTAVVISTTAAAQLAVKSPGSRDPLEGPAAVVLCQLFGQLGVPPASFCSPDPAQFGSMSSGHSGVPAHVKARAGTLFPMPAGLCFLESPALFIPREEIKAMELARAGGTSSTFDVFVHRKDGRVEEFGMLPREETGPFESYMMNQKLGPPADDSEGSDRSEDSGDASSSSDAEDETFDPEAGSSDEDAAPGGSRQPGTSDAGSSDDSDSEGEAGSDVELVSEDDMSTAALQQVLAAEGAAAGPRKRRRSSE